jgi:hypothetical protein
VAAI